MLSRTVLVTGGTGTLGSAIVRALKHSAPDLKLIANFHRDLHRAELLQNETGCELHRADIGDEAQVEAMFEALPPLLAVIHAAGVSDDGLLARQTRLRWEQTQRANLDGAFLAARGALAKLEDGGHLVFLASRVGENGNAGQAAYAASKAGVIALMKCAAKEGASRRLAVNAVCPGFVPSAMNENLSAASLQVARRASLFGELGDVREVASLVCWLLNEAGGAVSGQVLHCDARVAGL